MQLPYFLTEELSQTKHRCLGLLAFSFSVYETLVSFSLRYVIWKSFKESTWLSDFSPWAVFGPSASAVTKVIVPDTRVLNVTLQRQGQIAGSGCLFFIQWNH